MATFWPPSVPRTAEMTGLAQTLFEEYLPWFEALDTEDPVEPFSMDFLELEEESRELELEQAEFDNADYVPEEDDISIEDDDDPSSGEEDDPMDDEDFVPVTRDRIWYPAYPEVIKQVNPLYINNRMWIFSYP